ncbi:flagellar biosynthesis protein FlgJ [Jannaschia sp. KMU-145]|uniref:flagellar biosynthesis protein FlgJ n=1 Tax=Jannaschia halovivens TaxID=3388667 RepID=UPI00396B3B59
MTISITAPPAPADRVSAPDPLREQAVQLEAFLFAEMMRASGTGPPGASGGGESQFDSFLRRAQAEAVAGSGQTGLAEAIHRAMLRGADRAG